MPKCPAEQSNTKTISNVVPCASSAIILEKPAESSSWSAMSGGMAPNPPPPKPPNGPIDGGCAAEAWDLLLFGFGRGSKARPLPLLCFDGCGCFAELQVQVASSKTFNPFCHIAWSSHDAQLYLLEALVDAAGS